MEPLYIESRRDTPLVSFNPELGLLKIIGRSHPEDPVKFWNTILKWMSHFLPRMAKDIIAEIDLNYFNTSSGKCLLDLLSMLEDYHNEDHPVLIKWFYGEEDDETREAGEDLAQDLNLDFDFIVKK